MVFPPSPEASAREKPMVQQRITELTVAGRAFSSTLRRVFPSGRPPLREGRRHAAPTTKAAALPSAVARPAPPMPMSRAKIITGSSAIFTRMPAALERLAARERP